MKHHKGLLALTVILLVVIIDQIIKIYVKTHFYLGEDYRITDWFQLVFVQNRGMAFGMELGSKLFLTLFRIAAVAALIWLIVRLRKRQWVSRGFMVCLALITAGAAGNIIDCVAYGLLFNNPMPPQVAVMFPPEGGYAPLFHGQVVDMFYFPLFSFMWPQWVPAIGGSQFLFFQPVFNFADAAISVGTIVLLFFYSRFITGDYLLRSADATDTTDTGATDTGANAPDGDANNPDNPTGGK